MTLPVVAMWLTAAVSLASARTDGPEWATRLVRDVTAESFPELRSKDIRVEPFTSASDFFQARFSLRRFLTGRRMRYSIRVNPASALVTASDEGKRAIVAHELAHVAYYAKGKRIHLLGLLRLLSSRYREHFEKSADLDALRRGYAQGLKEYRRWLYQHVSGPALQEKKRDCLTPEEIDAIQARRGK